MASTSQRRRLRGPDGHLSWVGLCSALALASVVAQGSGDPLALAWHASGWMRHPWMLWTASLSHLTPVHLIVNLAALLVMALLGGLLRAQWPATVAVLLAWPIGTLALAWWPQIGYYGGMSGLLMAMLAVLWVDATWQGSSRTASVVLSVVLLVKLLAEHAWSQPIVFDPAWGFNVVQAAHLSGALAGMLCAVLVRAAIAIRD